LDSGVRNEQQSIKSTKLGTFVCILCLFFGCSSPKIFVAKTKNEKIVIRSGNHDDTDFFIIESKVKRVKEYEMVYGCEYTHRMTQGLVKDYEDSHWRAVTDTVPLPVFFDITYEKNIVKPLQFMPIAPEEIELLEKAIEKSRPNGCYSRMKPDEIIGYVKRRWPGEQ